MSEIYVGNILNTNNTKTCTAHKHSHRPDVDRLAVVANARADGESKVATLGVRLLRLVQVVAHSGSILNFNKCYYKSLLLIFF